MIVISAFSERLDANFSDVPATATAYGALGRAVDDPYDRPKAVVRGNRRVRDRVGRLPLWRV
jgi:hypothetical protein